MDESRLWKVTTECAGFLHVWVVNTWFVVAEDEEARSRTMFFILFFLFDSKKYCNYVPKSTTILSDMWDVHWSDDRRGQESKNSCTSRAYAWNKTGQHKWQHIWELSNLWMLQQIAQFENDTTIWLKTLSDNWADDNVWLASSSPWKSLT